MNFFFSLLFLPCILNVNGTNEMRSDDSEAIFTGPVTDSGMLWLALEHAFLPFQVEFPQMVQHGLFVYKPSSGCCRNNTTGSVFCCGEDRDMSQIRLEEEEKTWQLQLAKVNIRLQSESTGSTSLS